jgi:small conductance mechanosensitive channel
MDNMQLNVSLLNKLWQMTTSFAPKLIVGIIIFIVGKIIISYAIKLAEKISIRREIEPTLRSFLLSLLKPALYILLTVNIAAVLGFETSSFVAILGAASLAIGLSLQGSLSNFAGGVLILLFKPFKVGDYVEAAGINGTVQSIKILYTTLLTPDNKQITVPNGTLSNNPIVNYNAEPTRRVDITFGISYEDDIDKAKVILTEIINNQQLILQEPEPFIGVIALADNSVNIVTRCWVQTPDYLTVYFYMQEEVKKRFDIGSISIPYPQRTLHIIGNSSSSPTASR